MENTNTVRVWVYWMILVVTGVILYCLYTFFQNPNNVAPTSVEDIIKDTPQPGQQPATGDSVKPIVKNPETPTKVEISSELNLDAPFYTQAPFSNWGYPWQEACEEASMLLAANVYGKHNWTRTEFNNQILKMVEWEKVQFGTYLDTTVAQNTKILNNYLGLKTVIHENPTLDDVKNILSK